MREQLPFPLGKDVPFQVVWKYFMNVYPQFKEGETLKILFHICRLYSHEELFPVLHKLGLKWEEDGQKAFTQSKEAIGNVMSKICRIGKQCSKSVMNGQSGFTLIRYRDTKL